MNPFERFIQGLLDTVGNAIRGVFETLAQAIANLEHTGQQLIGNILGATSAWIQGLRDTISGLVNFVVSNVEELTRRMTILGDQLRRVDFRVAERAHQYQQARLNRNPLGVLGETLQIFTERSGPPDLVNPAQGAPWVTVPQTVKEIQAFWDDGAHPVRVSLQTALDDFAAIVAGQARDLGPWPRRVTDLPGLADLPDTGLAAPDVESMLNPEDNTLVGKTTRGRL